MGTQLLALDPASPTDAAEIATHLRIRRHRFEPDVCALASRVRHEASDPLLRADALNVLGSAAVVAGDDEEGSRHFREALDLAWGSGAHAERVACVNLAMIVTRQRRLVEALAACRRACRVALQDGDPLGICLSHAQLAKTFMELGDSRGLREAVGVACAQRLELDAALSTWVPHLLAGLSAEVALQQGDVAAADRHAAAALEGADVIPEVLSIYCGSARARPA